MCIRDSSITNENIKEELLNDWDKVLKLANEIGDNKVNDVIISMYQWLKDNTSMTISIEDVICLLYTSRCV